MQGTLICDPTQPGGYCTQVNCTMNLCPNEAACVEFNAVLPGCAYNDRAGPMGSRTGEAFCMQQCFKQSDCRAGYECVSPLGPPWNARILDDDQTQEESASALRRCRTWTTRAVSSATTSTPRCARPRAPTFRRSTPAIAYFPDLGPSADAGPLASMMDAPADVSTDTLMSLVDSSGPETGSAGGNAGPPDGGSEAGPRDGGATDAASGG